MAEVDFTDTDTDTVTRFSSSLQDRHPKKNHQIVDGTTIHSSDVDTTDFYSNHHDGQRVTTSCYRIVRILQQHVAKWTVPDRHVEHVQTGHPYQQQTRRLAQLNEQSREEKSS